MAYTGALTNGKGIINQESLEEELTKEFGAKGTAYTIADSETGTEWVVTVKGTGTQADVPVTIPKPSNVASTPEATPTPALPTGTGTKPETQYILFKMIFKMKLLTEYWRESILQEMKYKQYKMISISIKE